MTTPTEALPRFAQDSQAGPHAAMAETRPLYWSVRREVWENRSLYIAPLVAAAVGLVIFVITLIYRPKNMDPMMAVEHAHPLAELAMPYSHTEMLITMTAIIVGIFYSLEALYGERRDRSILFWKSLPVSDYTTVLSKASIPLVVLPLISFVFTIAAQLIMLLLHTVALLISGPSVASLWTRLPLFQLEAVLLYSLITVTLWHAPIYMWLLLVSAWARRTPFLWVVLPPAAICVVEYLAFHTWHLALLLKDRTIGFAASAYNLHTPDGATIDAHFIPLVQLTPGRYLASPGLWVGLAVAAALLAAAVRLRRYREPI
jgi:ABC-2 type transport system permease protein